MHVHIKEKSAGIARSLPVSLFLNTAAQPCESPPVQLVLPPKTLDGDSSRSSSVAAGPVAVPLNATESVPSPPLVPNM